VRLFVAVEVPPLSAEVDWPRPPERHLTLRFLGELPPESVDRLRAAMSRAVEGMAPFPVRYRSAGLFPEVGPPRVAWVGVEEGARELTELAGRLDRALEEEGFSREPRPFRPHVTIGRIRDPRERDRFVALVRSLVDRELGRGRVEEVVLFESELRPGGAVHTPRARARLGASGEHPPVAPTSS
jgi:2'-5' RNA ligase